MSKKIGLASAIVVLVFLTWTFQPVARGADEVQQVGPDSVWTKMVQGQGFGATLVLSCSTLGIHGVTVLRYDERVPRTAETVWGTGEQIWIEDPRTANCDCPSFNELGPCRQGLAKQFNKP